MKLFREKQSTHQCTWGKTADGMGARKLPELQHDDKMVRTYKPRKDSKQ